MIIPKDAADRRDFYAQLVKECFTSRKERFQFYKELRNYYLFGSRDTKGATFNKIASVIDSLSSFIYSPDSVRFSLHLGETADETDFYKAVPLAREVKDHWRISGTHLRFGLGLRWSLVYGTMMMKVLWHKNVTKTYLVEPHQFGVLREDVTDLADQEAFAMCYTITKSQLDYWLMGNPRRTSIMALVGNAGGEASEMRFGEGMSRLLIGGPVDGYPGSLATNQDGSSAVSAQGGYDYSPRVETELVDMIDLYVLDDSTGDYNIVTIATPDIVIYDRPQKAFGVASMPHFVVIRPENNLYDYFWGDSFVAKLAALQDWRVERTDQVRALLAKQMNPPMLGIGLGGISDEKFAALGGAGGRLSVPDPTGKVETLEPHMPADVFKELQEIDRLFEETAGIGHVLQGKGEPGVRSRGQADLMARLGSSRPKGRAIMAEEAAEDVATLILRNIQEHSKQRFTIKPQEKLKQGLTFIAEQFTKDYEVKVDAHSSSPIFVEDRKQDAMSLLEAGAIDRETLLDIYDPPNVQMLKERLKLREAREAMQAQQEAAQNAGKPAQG